MFAFRKQPLKGLYQTYFFASTIICLPFWFIRNIPGFARPRKKWPLGRSVIVGGMRAYVESWWAIGLPDSPGSDYEKIANSPDAKKLGFEWVEALKEDLIVGEVKDIAQTQGVTPARTCGYWYQRETETDEKDRNAGPDEKVLLHFHGKYTLNDIFHEADVNMNALLLGGGYIVGSAHPEGGAIGPISSILLKHCAGISRVFAGGYRLSSSAPFPAKNPFPAALFDALASYYHLIHVKGFRPENIIVGGDSAGGNLALAFARYVVLNHNLLPVPGALLLLSPTVEWDLTHTGKDSSMQRNARSDYCNIFFTGYTQRSLVGKLPIEFSNTSPWISPASLKLPEDVVKNEFDGFPKTFLCAGDAEICLDSYRTLNTRLASAIGDRLVYDEVPDATHDFLTMDWHEPERTETAKQIAAWVEKL